MDEELLKTLRAQCDVGQKQRDDTEKAIKEAGLGMMNAVAAHRKRGNSEL